MTGDATSALVRATSQRKRTLHGLEPRSRRPRASPHRTPEALEDEIIELRKELLDQGLDAGAHTIAVHLGRRHGSAPAVATIWRVLSRRGFVTPQPQHLVVASVLWAAIGVGVGLAVQHQVAAIVGALLWSMVGESALSALLPDLAKYLPGAAGSAIVGFDATDLLAPALAIAVLAGWAMLVTVTGGTLMQRRDIT